MRVNFEKFFPIIKHINLRVMPDKKEKKKRAGSDYNFELFFKNMPDLFCIADFDGTIKLVNDEWEKILGYSVSELEGKKCLDFIHPDDIERTTDTMALLKQFQQVSVTLNRCRCKDNSYRWIEWKTKSIAPDNLVYAAARDVTFREKNEEELSQIIHLNSKIFNTSRIGIVTYDKSGNCKTCNEAFAKIIGATKDQVLKQNFHNLDSWKNSELYNYSINAFKKEESFEREFLVKTPYGKKIWINIDAAPFVFEREKHLLFIIQDITESKTIANIIQESERKFRELLGNIKLLSLMLDSNGHIVYLNDYACNLLGYTYQEVLGKNWINSFVPDPDMRNEMYKQFKDETIPINFERYIVSKSGKKRLIRWTNTILRDPEGKLAGTASIGEDITEKKIIEDFLDFRYKLIEVANTNNLEKVLQFTLDTAEKITESKIGFIHFFDENQETTTLHTWSSNTIKICKAASKGSHYPIEKTGIWMDAVRQKGPIIHNDYQALNNKNGLPDGHIPLVRELVFPIFHNDKAAAILGVGNKDGNYDQTDIDKISLLADSAWNVIYSKIVEEDLKKSETQLRESNSTKDKFFSIIAHDLKSPFLGLLGFSKMLVDDYDSLQDEEKKQYINGIHNLANNTYKLLTNLLDWSQLQRSRMELNPEILNLYENIIYAVQLIKGTAEQKSISIETKIDDSLNVKADKNMLETILRNIISNAIKFSYPNSKIFISAKTVGELAEISVKDFGLGINEDCRNNLFQIDKNISTRGTDNECGTGLGLILCKEMVELNGGKIWIESDEFKGTTVFFTIPIDKSTHDQLV
jgi:two-component system, OmpR family, phosphate regulon sensor histidine kinase PhoR